MRAFLCIFLVALCEGECFGGAYDSSNYFCKEMTRQTMIDIPQLEGIWYLIEKIIHTEERHLHLNLTTCPIIHIAEDRDIYSTLNPLYGLGTTLYGSAYPHNIQYGQYRQPDQYGQYGSNHQPSRNPTDPKATFSSEQDFIKQTEEYDQRTTYDYKRRKGMQSEYNLFGMKRLKIHMSDGSSTFDQRLKYNSSDSGFWIISGPEEGTQENTRHFAGIIQVIKAVGNHLVLTTCKSSREIKELYTMILSRENYLDNWDINRVHLQLIQQGQRTNFIEKTCNSASFSEANFHFLSLIFMFLYSAS
ncbi:uncharacterized protein [Euwallacea fornicatus]|uniref:uncharacterized protein n=1 Tax=Euwallacea fornicatus TaxID=995702 RepID=UPI0033900DCE